VLAIGLHLIAAGGWTGTETLAWLDGHFRYALPLTAWHQVTGSIVLAAST
jgi:hypothetical protein